MRLGGLAEHHLGLEPFVEKRHQCALPLLVERIHEADRPTALSLRPEHRLLIAIREHLLQVQLLSGLALPLQAPGERFDELPSFGVDRHVRVVVREIGSQCADVLVPEAARLECGHVGLDDLLVPQFVEPRIERLPLRERAQIDDILPAWPGDETESVEALERRLLIHRQLHGEVEIRPLLVRDAVADEGGRIRVLLLALERREVRFELRPQRLRARYAWCFRLLIEWRGLRRAPPGTLRATRRSRSISLALP